MVSMRTSSFNSVSMTCLDSFSRPNMDVRLARWTKNLSIRDGWSCLFGWECLFFCRFSRGKCQDAVCPLWLVINIKRGNEPAHKCGYGRHVLVFFDTADVTVVIVHLGGKVALGEVSAFAQEAHQFAQRFKGVGRDVCSAFCHRQILHQGCSFSPLCNISDVRIYATNINKFNNEMDIVFSI